MSISKVLIDGMTESEYLEKLKRLGWTDQMINDSFNSIKYTQKQWRHMLYPGFFRKLFHKYILKGNVEDWYFPHHPGNW